MKEKLKIFSKKKYKEPYPTIGDVIEGKSYDYVSYRVRFEKEKYEKRLPDYYFAEGMFAGAFAVNNGEIVPLDNDTYYKNEEVLESEEWQQLTDEGETINGLTIVVTGELYEFPSEEEKEKKEA